MHVGAGNEIGILQSIVEPQSREVTLYQAATLQQMKSILQTDFLDAAKHGYIADINLLSAGRSLYQSGEVYRKILELHTQSYNLYNDQNSFNRACQSSILQHAEITQRSASKVCGLIEKCGSRLETLPADFQDIYSSITAEEAEHSLALYQDIATYSGEFLAKLRDLKRGIDECFEIIRIEQKILSNKNVYVRALSAVILAIKDLESVVIKKESQVKNQIDTIRKKLKEKYRQSRKAFDAVDSLCDYKDKILNAHAIWLQLEQQCSTIRAICDDETQIRTLVIEDVERGVDAGLQMIKGRLEAIQQSQTEGRMIGMFKQPTVARLLEDRR